MSFPREKNPKKYLVNSNINNKTFMFSRNILSLLGTGYMTFRPLTQDYQLHVRTRQLVQYWRYFCYHPSHIFYKKIY